MKLLLVHCRTHKIQVNNIYRKQERRMIFKFAKAELKDSSREGHLLTLSVELNGVRHALKTARKIRNGVANFFGETLELAQSAHPLAIFIHQTCPQNQKNQIAHFKFSFQQPLSNRRSQGSMVQQNGVVKLFWAWEIEVRSSRKYSEDSRDLMNVETPKKGEDREWREWRALMKMYSPDSKRGNQIELLCDQAMSEKGDSPTKHGPDFRKTKKLLNQEGLKSLIKSKSAATRSKTPSKAQPTLKKSCLPQPQPQLQPQKPSPPKNPSKKPNCLTDSKILGRQANRISPSSHNHRRRNSLNGSFNGRINKLGTVLAGTVGLFAGLFAGFAASY